jgi:hypothetical protein
MYDVDIVLPLIIIIIDFFCLYYEYKSFSKRGKIGINFPIVICTTSYESHTFFHEFAAKIKTKIKCSNVPPFLP